MKNYLNKMWLAIMAITMVACVDAEPEQNPPTPTPNPTLTDNSAIYMNEKIEFKSVVVEDFDGMYFNVYASPEAGITTVDEMMKMEGNTYVHKHISLSVTPDQLGTAVDVMTSEDYFFSNETTLCPTIKELSPGDTDLITGGTIKITFNRKDGENSGKIVAEFNITVKDGGKVFEGRFDAQYTEPEPEQEPIENGVRSGDTEKLFKSMIIADRKDPNMNYIIASEIPGLTTFDDMMKRDGNGKYVNKPLMIQVGKSSMDAYIADVLKAGPHSFGIYNYTGVCEAFTSFSSSMTSDPIISAGSLQFTLDEVTGEFTVDFNLTVKETSEQFIGNITMIYVPTPEPETNLMKVDAEKGEAIVSKYFNFNAKTKEMTFHITPFNVLGNEVESREHFAALTMHQNIMNGAEHDITELAVGDFTFNYCNPKAGVQSAILIRPGVLRDATGWIKASVKGDSYILEYEIKYNGHTLYAQAQDDFDNYNYASYIEYQPMGPRETLIIRSVILDQSSTDELSYIYFSDVRGITTVSEMNESGKPFVMILPSSYLATGQPAMFAEEVKAAFIFKEVTYTAAQLMVGPPSMIQMLLADGKLSGEIFAMLPEGETFQGYYDASSNFTHLK